MNENGFSVGKKNVMDRDEPRRGRKESPCCGLCPSMPLLGVLFPPDGIPRDPTTLGGKGVPSPPRLGRPARAAVPPPPQKGGKAGKKKGELPATVLVEEDPTSVHPYLEATPLPLATATLPPRVPHLAGRQKAVGQPMPLPRQAFMY